MQKQKLRLKRDALDARRLQAGLATTVAFAQYIGVSQAQVSRIFNGKSFPGPDFIAALVAAFPDATIDDLFEVVEEARVS